MQDRIAEIKKLHLDSFSWKASQVPFGIWVVDTEKFEKISMDDEDFDEKFLKRQLTILSDTRRVPSDLLPVLGVTNYGIAVVPSLFGAPLTASSADVDLIEETGYWVHPIINSQEDLDELAGKKFDSEFFQKVKAHMIHYRNNKPDDVWISNSLDGPFSIAALLRGPEIYTDMVDDPPFAHAILGLCTDVIIECEKQLREAAGHTAVVEGAFPTYFGIYAPGLRFGDDSLINLSQDMIEEYVLPCYERIAASFQCQLLIHFCSVRKPIGKQIIRAFADSPAIAGISSQLGYELYDEMEEEIRGKLMIECGYGNGIAYGIEKYGSFRDFAKHIKNKKNTGMILYTTVSSVKEAQMLWEEWNSVS